MSAPLVTDSPASEIDIPLCSLSDIAVGLARAFTVNSREIAVFRTREDQVFAIEGRCPHRGAPLAEGMLAGESVVCPFHGYRFELASGKCDQKSCQAVKTYPVRVDGEQILLQVKA